MKIQTLIEILFLLLSREKVSAKYIADKFGISLRTVYRYIDELSIPVPIYNVRGRNGGYMIADSFKISASFLTEEEKKYLLGTLKEVDNEVGSDVLKRIICKIETLTKLNQTETPINLGNLIIDGSAWGSTDEYKQILTLIQTCIEKRTALKIKYFNRNGDRLERVIEPHTLLLKQGLWYCYAYCTVRNEFRLFKIGRIESAKATNKQFNRREIGNVEEAFAEWYQKISSVDLDIEIDESVRHDVEEWLGVGKVYETSAGKIKASCKVPLSKDVTAKILSFGNKVKVISPTELKKEVIANAKKIIKNYE
ncbi:MAG: YafY family transcriptional regulator [Clostridia bacterium]|nr:YafY family transcriptional regulator [Clostridia bacterium]